MPKSEWGPERVATLRQRVWRQRRARWQQRLAETEERLRRLGSATVPAGAAALTAWERWASERDRLLAEASAEVRRSTRGWKAAQARFARAQASCRAVEHLRERRSQAQRLLVLRQERSDLEAWRAAKETGSGGGRERGAA